MLKRMNAKQQETGMDYLDMAQSVQALGDSSMNITLRCAPPPATHRLLPRCTSCASAPPATLCLLRPCGTATLRLLRLHSSTLQGATMDRFESQSSRRHFNPSAAEVRL